MTKNDFYVLVDTNTKQIISKLEPLPEYWKNIAGLTNFSEEELKDLSWSGNPGLGWIKITSELLGDYSSSPENLTLNKNHFKQIISDHFELKKEIGVTYKNIRCPVNKTTIFDLNIKNLQADQSPEKTFVYKIINDYYSFRAEEIKELCDLINQHDIELSLSEMNIFKEIESCSTVHELSKINYDL